MYQRGSWLEVIVLYQSVGVNGRASGPNSFLGSRSYEATTNKQKDEFTPEMAGTHITRLFYAKPTRSHNLDQRGDYSRLPRWGVHNRREPARAEEAKETAIDPLRGKKKRQMPPDTVVV